MRGWSVLSNREGVAVSHSSVGAWIPMLFWSIRDLILVCLVTRIADDGQLDSGHGVPPHLCGGCAVDRGPGLGPQAVAVLVRG